MNILLKIGEKVVYGKTGVCIVEGQCEKEFIKNQKKQYFVLKPLGNQNNTIFAPVDGNKVFIRPIITKTQANELILKIPEISENTENTELTREQYETMIATHNCEDLVGLTTRLYQKKKSALENRKKAGLVDERYMALAEKLLFGELSAALEIPFENVKSYISEKLNNK